MSSEVENNSVQANAENFIDASKQAQQQAYVPKVAAQGQGTGTDPGYTAATQVASLEDLKNKAPKLYDQMLMGIATSIMWQMKRKSDHLKEMIREGSRKS